MSRKLGAEATIPSPSTLRVLVADDAAEIRLLLRRSLELDGSVEVVGEASNGAEAVQMVETNRPDVVLLDLAMPVLDGLRAIPQIRQCSPETQIVVLSAFNASQMEERAFEAGATAFVSKASGPDTILATLRDVSRFRDSSAKHPPAPRRFVPGSMVTRSKKLAVETADNRKHDLLPMLTHEIGNQLTVIQGFAEMLADGIGHGLPADTARQFAESIVRNAKQMSGLLETVSEVRKLDQGTLELQMAEVDLRGLARHAISDLAGLLGDRPVTLELPTRAVVAADPVRVRHLLTSLISNAAKFTPPSTPVTVAVGGDDSWVELAVTDSGPGIPSDQQDQLFEKFSRLNTTVKGSGMGLYLARGIARAHAGELLFFPQDPGCRFVLRLPRVAGAIGR